MRLNVLEDEVAEPDALHSVQQTRELIRFNTVQRFGLLPSLTLELERIQRTGRIQTQLITTGNTYALGEQAKIVLLRMAQESLNNALKHARACTLTVSTDYLPNAFLLTIDDDGQGFNQEDVAAQPLDQAGAGLGNLYRRAGLLGGTCTIVS